MAKYGDSAILAVNMVLNGRVNNPIDAWSAAVEQMFPNQPASQKKGCPKGAFLGLCEEGLVEGIHPGTYTRSHLNKHYAIDALSILRSNPALSDDSHRLWQEVMNGKEKSENAQMDVVITLWRRGFLRDE